MGFRRIVDGVEILAVIATAVFVVLLFANEPSDDDAGPAPAAAGETPTETAAVDGAALYDQQCAACHGGDGNSGFAPDLGGGLAVEKFPDPEDQIAVVTEGRGRMPGFGGRLTAEEIEAIVDYTRSEL